MSSNLEKLLLCIGKRNLLQRRYVNESIKNISEEEISDLEKLIIFYSSQNYSIEYMADSYLTFVEDSLKEQLFFRKNGFQYRYSKFEDVSRDVYFNHEYMNKYMIGLAISQYLWSNHIGLRRWFEEKIINDKILTGGGLYLEIGPGHGNHFAKALSILDYEKYLAIDISETSVMLTRRHIEFFLRQNPRKINYEVRCQDFFDLKEDVIYDTIVMGEVLEHVENPLLFLHKIYKISNENTTIFISTVINAPARDHIFLFQNKKEVFSLCNEAKFHIKEYSCFTANNISYAQAEKEHQPMLIGMLLEKQNVL